MIYIQKIVVIWTKKSRGAPMATLRNRVPEQFPLSIPSSEAGIYLQEINYHENSDFKEPSAGKLRKINENQVRQEQLKFEVKNDQLMISGYGFRSDYGTLKQFGVLKQNSWLKLITNMRIPLEYTWSYQKIVYNIFYGDPFKFDDMVKNQKAVIVYDERVL